MCKLLLVFVFCFGLAGCETMQQQPQKSGAQFEKERIIGTLQNADANFKVCSDEYKQSETYKRVFAEVFYESDESSNKFTMLANTKKPTDEQIELVKNALPTITGCRKILLDGYSNTPFLTVNLKYYNSMDAMLIRFIKGDISIGDANEERAKAAAQRKMDWANTSSEIDARLRTMHDNEINGRRQAAAAMLPYLMQQQQNQQMQQQMFYQQQMQNINNNRTILTSPTQTNCTTYGNQTNCTSR